MGASGEIGDEGERIEEAPLVGMILNADQIQAGLIRDPNLLDDGSIVIGVGRWKVSELDVSSVVHDVSCNRRPRRVFRETRHRRRGQEDMDEAAVWESVEFCGIRLRIDPGVFVPRPRTKVLASAKGSGAARPPPFHATLEPCARIGPRGS